MALVATHRQIVWRQLERTIEVQRQLCNAALEERIDCLRKLRKGR